MAGKQITDWFTRIASLFRPFRDDADLKDELRVHLELQAEDNVRPGVSPEEARRQARLRVGNTQAIVERVRDRELITVLESWYRDFVVGMRALRKNPVFCVTAILTLAVGIGANTAVFTLLYGLLLRSLPAKDPQQLVRIGIVNTTRPGPAGGVPYRMLPELQKMASFTGISAWRSRGISIADEDGTLRNYEAGLVSGNAFEVFGMTAHLGRLITSSDDVRGGAPEGWPVVLSYDFWTDRYGGDPGILGKSIKISHATVTIVGIAPRGFEGVWPGNDHSVYLPMQYLPVLLGRDDLNSPAEVAFCSAIARLRAGKSAKEADAELAVREQDLLMSFIPPDRRTNVVLDTLKLKIESARTGLPTFLGRTYSTPLYMMQALVGVVLLLCCVNVSGLMLSKIHERQREFAVRTAIGAARWRLTRQYLVESFVIAASGAALGAAGAWFCTPLLLGYFRHPNFATQMTIQPDRMVFLVTGVFAVGTTLLFGIVPAWRAGRSDPGLLLRARTIGARRRMIGRAFVPVQIALSVVLVTIAALLSQSLLHLRGEPTGFELDRVTIQTPPLHRLPVRGDAKLDLYQRMIDRIMQSPGVNSAAVTWYTPMTGFQSTTSFQAAGASADAPQPPVMAFNDVGPGYFQAIGTKIVSGREFLRNERNRNVCVVNTAAAQLLFGYDAPVGQYVQTNDRRVFPGGLSCQIVGIAQNAKFANLHEAPPPTIYFPATSETVDRAGNLVFLINARTKPDAIAAYSAALKDFAPTIPLVLFPTLREQMDAALGSQRAITALSNWFGALALFLSAIGLYGMLSANVAQRTAEIGVRMAMGARRGTVVNMILSSAFRLVAVGFIVGVLALTLAVESIKHMLYGVSSFDAITLVLVTVTLAVVALVAAFLPAIRAASVDPIRALRCE